MEQKKRSVFEKISIVYFIWMLLYFSGALLLRATDLEYRMWVWFLGNCSLFWGLPVWLFFVWFRWHVRRGGKEILRVLVTTVLAVVFLLWSVFCFICMALVVHEEHWLFGGYFVVDHGGLGDPMYVSYKSKALFFRERTDWDADFEIEYLEQKYHREFQKISVKKEVGENNYLYDENGERILYYYEETPAPLDRPELPIGVYLSGAGDLNDDYVNRLTDWYITEGCGELNIDRSYETGKDGGIRLFFSGSEDIEAAASDVQRLMAYAMQDDIFQDYSGTIRLSPEDGKEYEYIYLSFGRVNRGNGTEIGYEKDLSVLVESIGEQYESILNNRKQRQEVEKERERRLKEEAAEREKRQAEEEAKRLREEEAGIRVKPPFDEEGNKQESTYEKEARLIFEEIRGSMDIEEDFSAECNARGEEYFLLGEDGTFQYTLVYNGDSPNEACRIYVLFRSPFDEESGDYYYYTDTMTQIADTYAVVKGTREIIASGKKSWGDAGSSAYREAVGE